MTARTKMWLMFVSALLSFLVFVFFANYSVYLAWQSAFTHANSKALEKWFYASCSLGILSIVAVIFFLLKGIKILKIRATLNTAHESHTIPKQNFLKLAFIIFICVMAISITYILISKFFHGHPTPWPFVIEIGMTFLIVTNHFYRHSSSYARLFDAISCGFGITACVAIISMLILVNLLGS